MLNNGIKTPLAIPEESGGLVSDVGGWRDLTSFRGKTVGVLLQDRSGAATNPDSMIWAAQII